MIVVAIFLIAFILPKQARFKFEYEKGKVWNQDDLISPFEFAIQKTPEQLDRDNEEVLKSVKPVYQLVSTVSKESIENVRASVYSEVNQLGLSDPEKVHSVKFAEQLLRKLYQRGIIELKKKYQRYNLNYSFSLLNQNQSIDLNTLEVYDIVSAKAFLKQSIDEDQLIRDKKNVYS